MAAERILKYTANGDKFVSIKAPPTLAASYTFVWPPDDGAPDQNLKTDGAGNTSWETLTFQVIYARGEDITLTAGKTIAWTQPLNEDLLFLNKTGAGAGSSLIIDDDGTGIALSVIKDGVGIAVNIDQDAAATALNVDQSAAATAVAVIQSANAAAVTVNKTGAGAGNALLIDDDGTGIGLSIVKDGAGVALQIAQNAAARALNITQAGNAAAALLTQTQNQPGLEIVKTGAVGGNALRVENDGTDSGIRIDQDGAGQALTIAQNGDATAVSIVQTQNQRGININKTGVGGNPAAEVNNAGTGIGLSIVQDGAGIALNVDQDGDARGIDVLQSTDQNAVRVQNDHGSPVQALVKLSNPNAPNSTDPDIEGTAAKWLISRGGMGRFRRVEWTAGNYTISAGAITLNETGLLVVDTEAAAATDDLDNINVSGGDTPQEGCIIYVVAANDARTVVVRHNGGGAGNIRLDGLANKTLDNTLDVLALMRRGSLWVQVGFSNNGA